MDITVIFDEILEDYTDDYLSEIFDYVANLP